MSTLIWNSMAVVRSLALQMWPHARAVVLLLLAAATGAGQALPPTLRDEAQALLRRGIPVALVLGPELQTALQARATVASGADRGDDRRVLLTGLAARWAGRLDVFDDGAVVTLRDRTPPCVPQLGRSLDASGIVGPPIVVVQALAAKLDPRLERLPPPGMMGSVLGRPDDPGDDARREAEGRTVAMDVVTLGGGTTSLQAALNELVTKAGGIGWAIGSEREGDGREVCRIALLTRSSVVLTFYDILPP